MITGIHAIFYTKHSKEMYHFLKDVLDLHCVDAGNGRFLRRTADGTRRP